MPQASRIAIVGGGKFCKALLELLLSELFQPQQIDILAVADKDPKAPGLVLAATKGIWTTQDFTALYGLKDLEAILELTGDHGLKDIIKQSKPARVQLIDHVQLDNPGSYEGARVCPRPGDGYDYRPFLKALKEAGYSSDISLPGDADAAVLHYCRELWGE